MSKNNKKELVPELRFPEFREYDEWEDKNLINACDMQAGKFVRSAEIKDKQEDALFPCFGGNGLRGFTKSFTHEGEYSLIGRQGALCGNVTLANGKFHATEHAVVVTPKKRIDTHWLYYELIRLNLNQYATGQAQPGLSVENLERVRTNIPSHVEEQQKIAACLFSLDELIAAHTQKHQALQSYKKGLLQNLFPAEGESVPALRFAEFRRSADWKPRKLGDKDISDFVKKRLSLSDLSIETYVSTENILANFGGIAKVSKLPTSGSFTAYKSGDILIANIRPYLKKVWVANRSGGASNDVVVVRPKKGTAFLSCILRNEAFINYVMQGAKGVKMPRGDIDLMKEYPIAVPNPDEQHKIAECLSSIDDLIRAQAQKIEELKAHKKGLMQQLFPAMDEVGA